METKKIPTRNGFGEAIVELGQGKQGYSRCRH